MLSGLPICGPARAGVIRSRFSSLVCRSAARASRRSRAAIAYVRSRRSARTTGRMAYSEIITTGSVVIGSTDVTADTDTALLTATDRSVEIVAPAWLGYLGELSVSIPTEAVRALLDQLDE